MGKDCTPYVGIKASLIKPTNSGPKLIPTRLRQNILIAAAVARMRNGARVWITASEGPKKKFPAKAGTMKNPMASGKESKE
jgi:hypothetical protein